MRLAAFRTLCYNTGNRPSCILGGANQRIHAAAFARNPVALPAVAAYGLVSAGRGRNAPAVTSAGFFFNHSLVGWAVPSPWWRSKRATGDNGVRRMFPRTL